MTPDKNLDYHSFEVQEIIERVPKWTSRWGISSLLAILCILLVVSSKVTVPVKKRFEVLLKITNPPLHITNKPGNIITPSTKAVKIKKGDILVKNQLSGELILAPYSGTLTKVSPVANTGEETVSIFLPDDVSYQFEGKVPVNFKKLVKTGDKLNLIIASNNFNEDVRVYGIVKDISPIAFNNELVFYGNLSAESNRLLKKDFLYSSKINGINEVTVSNDTILNMLFGKIK